MSTEQVYSKLASHISGLANMRALVRHINTNIARLEAEIAETPKGILLQAFKTQLADAKELQSADEAAARQAAHHVLKITGNKKPHSAITFKSYTVLDYDETAAFDYAIQHLPGALKFNKTPFEKVAKVAALDFVTISTEMRPTIASDLSEYEDSPLPDRPAL